MQDAELSIETAMPMGERLVAAGIERAGSREAKLAKREMGCMLGEALVRLGLVAESNVAKYLSEELGVPIAEGHYPDEPVVVDALPEQFLLSNHVVPLFAQGVHYDGSTETSRCLSAKPFI